MGLIVSLILGAVLLKAQNAPVAVAPAPDDQQFVNNSTYSTAISEHRNPKDLLLQKEGPIASAQSEYARIVYTVYAAKAALEDGQIDKARNYATQALSFAEKHSSPGGYESVIFLATWFWAASPF